MCAPPVVIIAVAHKRKCAPPVSCRMGAIWGQDIGGAPSRMCTTSIYLAVAHIYRCAPWVTLASPWHHTSGAQFCLCATSIYPPISLFLLVRKLTLRLTKPATLNVAAKNGQYIECIVKMTQNEYNRTIICMHI